MSHENTADDIVARLKHMPRHPLSPQSEERIVYQLRQAADRAGHRAKLVRRLRRIIIVSFVIGLFFLVPLLWDTTAAQWISAFGKSEEPWEVSPTFDLIDEDGSTVYPDAVRGVEGKIGLLESYTDPDGLIAKEPIPKSFWYAWGNPDDLIGKQLIASAVHQETGEEFILNESILGEPMYNADASMHANLFNPFPLKGHWRIDVFIDGSFFESIFVYVKDEYIQTESAKFIISRDDVKVGETDVILLFKGDINDKKIEVSVTSMINRGETELFEFYRDKHQNIPRITGYHGALNFDKPGKWEIEVLGEKTIVDVYQTDPEAP